MYFLIFYVQKSCFLIRVEFLSVDENYEVTRKKKYQLRTTFNFITYIFGVLSDQN